MGLQLWRMADVEHIFRGMEVTVSATVAANGAGKAEPGFRQGFETALQRVILSLDQRPLAQGIGFRGDIKNILLAVRAVRPRTVATPAESNSFLPQEQGFAQGFDSALAAIATSFGINLLAPHDSLLSPPEPASSPTPFWFREDIDHILLALQAVMLATSIAAEDQSRLANYQQGFEEALQCLAQSLGLNLLPEANMVSEQAADLFWLRQHIQNNLQTLYNTTHVTLSEVENHWSAAYNQGFETALHCLAQVY